MYFDICSSESINGGSERVPAVNFSNTTGDLKRTAIDQHTIVSSRYSGTIDTTCKDCATCHFYCATVGNIYYRLVTVMCIFSRIGSESCLCRVITWNSTYKCRSLANYSSTGIVDINCISLRIYSNIYIVSVYQTTEIQDTTVCDIESITNNGSVCKCNCSTISAATNHKRSVTTTCINS